ncbi:MAG: DNA-binding protein [Holophagaceae bacterium]|nr:DNA-binding protein [Holophagaceae bacterium]
MRRADRLFQIVQLLRRDRISTAAKLARELEISERTLYRDIAHLMASGVPIESEAGVGYSLSRHFDLPPLMLSAEEGEALLLGARTIEAWADPALREAARSLLRKVEAVLPPNRREAFAALPFLVPDVHVPPNTAHFLGDLRRGLREKQRLRLGYVRADGTPSERAVQPVGLIFWGYRWHLAAWCELREALRTFRVDRIQSVAFLGPFEAGRAWNLTDYLGSVRREGHDRGASGCGATER